jgi:uncharacterized metal-binding protein
MMKALVTCSGLSNTGRLTTQVATILVNRHPASVTWVKAHKDEENIADAAEESDLIIVLEGCSDRCASKKISGMGLKADIILVATELGVKKNGMAGVQWKDVEKLITVIEHKINGV